MGSLAANIQQRILHFINLSSSFFFPGNIRFPYFFAIAAIFLFLENHPASAATVIWNGLGSDGTCGTGNGNNWTCGQNWTGGIAPGFSDIAQFDATSTKDSSINSTFTGIVAGIDIKSTYTGTITQSHALIVSSTGGYSQAGGTFTGGNFDLDNNGSFTLSGGTFTAPSAFYYNAGNFTHTAGGTFNHNSGTVVFDLSSLFSVTVDVNTSETFNHLIINRNGGGNLVISAADTLTVLGTLTLIDGNIDGGISSIVDAQGNIVHGANFDGGSGHLTISGSSTRTINLTGGGQLPRTTVSASNLTMNGPSSGTVTFDGVLRWEAGTFSGGAGNLDLNSAFILTAGTFTAPSDSMFVAGNFTHTAGGTFTHNNGTVVLDANTSSIDVALSETFNNLTVNKPDTNLTITTGDILEVLGTLSLSNGNVNTGTINSYANMTHGSGFDGGNGTINIIGSNSRTIDLTGGGQLPNVFVNAANVTVNGPSSGTVSVDNNFSLQDGTFSGGAGDFTLIFGNFAQNGGNVTLGLGKFTSNGSFTFSNGTFTGGDGAINLNAGAALSGGAFNLGAGTLTVTNASYTQNAGTFNGGSTGTADFNGSFNLSGGVFNASKTIFFSSYYTHTGGTFNHNNGKVIFDSTFSMLIDVNATETFNDLEFSRGSGTTAAIGDDILIVLGQLSLKDGLVSHYSVSSTLEARGNVIVDPAFDGGTTPLVFSGGNSQTFDLTGATDKFDADVTITKSSGATVTLASDLIIDSIAADQDLVIISGTLDLASHNLTVGDDFAVNGTCVTGGNNTITVTDSFAVASASGNFNAQNSTMNVGRVTIAGGVFTSTSGTLTVLGNWTHTASTAVFNHNNGTVIFSGTGNSLVDVDANENFYNLTLNKTSGSGGTTDELTVTSTDSLTVLGTLQMTMGQSQGGTMNTEGNVIVGSGFAGGTTTMVLKGSGAQTFDLTGAVSKFDSDITVNKTGGKVDLLSGLTMDETNQDLLIIAGTFDINGNGLTVNGSSSTFILQSGGNFQLQGNETTTSPQQQSGSTITYDGSGIYSSLVLGNTYTSHLSFKGTGNWHHTSALTANANLSINSGTLNSGGQGINIGGNWDNTGTYISGNNTVTFTGTDQTIGGATTFNHLTKIASAASALTFPAGVTNTILGTMTLQGSSSSARLSLRSSVSGTRTQIDPQGSRLVQYLDVKDDKNMNNAAIPCLTDCISSGNNYHWLFGNQTLQFTASSSSGSEGITAVNLEINLSGSLADDAIVNYAVTGGSASGGGADYTLANGTATITAGNTTANIPITIVDDALNELDETIQVTLSNPINVTLGSTAVHTYTINNDDAAPAVTLSLTGSPMAENAGQAEVKATLSSVSGQNVTVDLSFSGTAALTDDYTRTGTQIVINAGQTEGTVTLTAVQDALNETDETIIADISYVTNGTESNPQQVTATITDDDSQPNVFYSQASQTQNENFGVVIVQVELSAPSGLEVTIPFTVGGNARNPEDYSMTSSPLTIPAGEISANISLQIVEDSVSESDETIQITMGTPINASQGTTTEHIVTLEDNDALPDVKFELSESIGSENTSSVMVRVMLSEASEQSITVNYLASGGTASGSGEDYILDSGSLTFDPSDTVKSIGLTIVNNIEHEADETVEISLSNPENAVLIEPSVFTYTIEDDDEEESEGTITMTADNCYVLYVNGVQIGSDCDWQTVENYTVDIQEGDIIAIKADDAGGIGGLAFQIQKGENLQVSDFTWHVFSSNVPPEGWEQAGFDASHWVGATEHYKMGEGPWGTLAGFDPSVKWIWSKNIVFNNHVFFITQFHPDQNALVKVSADNAFEAFVNGEEIGQGDAWPMVKFMPAHIEEGDVIAIHGADAGGLGGILSETLWRDEAGNLRKILSDGTWKASTNYDNGWLDQDFDDSSWLFAAQYGRRGVYPWANNGNLLEITSQAFWIWSAHASSDSDVWVRKQIPNGNIQIAADNKYELYVNGRLIGTGISWLETQDYSVYLQEGDVIAVKAENLGGPAGVISSIVLDEEVLLTNSSWKIHNLEETGWNEKDFDDSAWDQAKSFGSNDIWPWGRRAGIDPMAMWIWTHASETDNIVFLRFKIGQANVPQGLTKIECTADDEYSLYHNGYKVLEGNSWRILKNFYSELSSGDVLAIQAKDRTYKAGLLLEASGAFNFTSDETWKWVAVEEAGWQGLHFNDSGWLGAQSYGSYGAQPWGMQVIGFPGSSAAQWIWSHRNETGGSNRDTNVFFRKNID